MPLAEALDLALRATGVPIVGVSIGDPVNRATWRVDFADPVTAKQRTDAAALLQSFDLESPTVAAQVLDDDATRILHQPLVLALVLYLLRKQIGKEPPPDVIAQEHALVAAALKDVLAA